MTQRHVLIPLDGSKSAESALSWIDEVCAPGDQIVLISVRAQDKRPVRGYAPGIRQGGMTSAAGGFAGAVSPEVPVYAETTDQLLQTETAEVQDYLDDLASPLRKSGRSVQTHVVIGDKPDQAIVHLAREHAPCLIVLKRRPYLGQEDVLGQTTAGILRANVAPVFLVPTVDRRSS